MAASLNKVLLMGHLGDEVKMHYFEGGNCLGRFSIATNETYTNKANGKRVTTTEWHNIVVRNKLAEVCEKYLSKGDLIYLEGRIKSNQWESKDGIKRYSTEIHVLELQFINTKKGALKTETTSNKNASATQKTNEEDLPF